MEVSHQVTHQLKVCIALNLGKMFKSPFTEIWNLIKRLPKWWLKIKEQLNQEDLLLMINTKPPLKFLIQATKRIWRY